MPEPQKRIKTTYELPEYARDFRNLPVEEQEQYYIKFGLKTAVQRRLFSFLCQTISAARQKTKQAVTTYKYYADIVLKWASNPNNLRAIQGFPRSEETLKNNLDPLLKQLIKKGVCRVHPSMEEPDDSKMICLQPESMFGAPDAEKELEEIEKKLSREFDKVADDPRHPLPTRKLIETAIGRTLNKNLSIETLASENFNREELAQERYKNPHLVQVSFGKNHLVLLLPGQLQKLPEIAARRLVAAIKGLPNHAFLDTMIKEKFPSEGSLNMKQLMQEKGNTGLPDFSSNLSVWTSIAYLIMNEIKRLEKEGIDRLNKRLASYLMLTWFSFERTREFETGLEDALIQDLYRHIESHRRYMTISELRNREKSKEHIKRHGEESFNELLSRFIQDHSPENNPEKAIIRLTGKVIGTYYIHSCHILSLFHSIVQKEKNKVDMIAGRVFVRPISENLYRNNIEPEVQHWLDDDASIEEKFRDTLKNEYSHLTELHSFIDIYDFFSTDISTISFLASRYHIAENHFLLPGPGGSKLLRPLLGMLDITGAELLRRAQRQVPLLRKYLYMLKNLFSGRAEGSGEKKQPRPHQPHRAIGAKTPKPHSPKPAKTAQKTNPAKKSPAGGKKAAQTPRLPDQKKPAGAKTIPPDQLKAAFSKGRDAEYYLGIWNRVLGAAADKNLEICHAIIKKKLGAMERRLKSGDKYVNVAEQATYIAYAPQLGHIEKKSQLTSYIQLTLLKELENLRKTKNLRFEYISTPK